MIKVDKVSFAYSKKNVLNDISFEVKPGTCVGIIGANGCGKSTLLSLITGSFKPKSGKITINSDVNLGYVPQENPLLPDLSAYDNLLLLYKGSKKQLNEELKNELVSMLGIDNFLKKPVKKLSGGMKKRVSLAIALINEPTVLIMDEPSAALDLPCKSDMHMYLRKFISLGRSVIITTHDEDELDLCDVLYCIKDTHLVKVDNKLRGDDLVKFL